MALIDCQLERIRRTEFKVASNKYPFLAGHYLENAAYPLWITADCVCDVESFSPLCPQIIDCRLTNGAPNGGLQACFYRALGADLV